ncbi:MAG: hypothetical protein U0570_00705 [Phycisphaerales bacterium]
MTKASDTNINTLRLICFMLSAGMLMFAIVAIVIALEKPGTFRQGPPRSPDWMFLVMTLATGIGALIIWTAARRFMLADARGQWSRPGDVALKERSIWGRFSSMAITRAALAEGFGLLGIVSLLVAGQWWGLAAPLIAIGIILATLPSQDRYEQFLEKVTAD